MEVIIFLMKLAYITAQIPWSRRETFILEEILAIKKQEEDILIFPRNSGKEVYHASAKGLIKNSKWLPLINLKMVLFFILYIPWSLSLWKILKNIIINSKTFSILLKNLVVLPKGIYLTRIMKKQKISHVHSHWGSTTATMAYVISKFGKIPWSFTLHRWDIKENNMLEEKVKSAKFVRCISINGKNELYKIIGNKYRDKIKLIHMGVNIPSNFSKINNDKSKIFKIVIPANLLAVKGHRYIIEACSILVEGGIKIFECIFYGEGLLRNELEELIKRKLLNHYIKIPGIIPHEKLMKIYKNHGIDLVVLPSINTENGEHEGIPVVLMEAMAYHIPVISTNTGGIPELLGEDAGIIVQEKNPSGLVKAILKLWNDTDLKEEIALNGYKRVKKDFNIEIISKNLLKNFKKYSDYKYSNSGKS